MAVGRPGGPCRSSRAELHPRRMETVFPRRAVPQDVSRSSGSGRSVIARCARRSHSPEESIRMSRRKRISLTWSILAFMVLALTAGSGARRSRAEEQPALPFVIPADFEDLDFCAWRIEPGQPDPHNPLVEPAMPWDAGGVLAHGTVLHDPIDGMWKVWQHSIPRPEGKPDKQDSGWWTPRLTYLESKD